MCIEISKRNVFIEVALPTISDPKTGSRAHADRLHLHEHAKGNDTYGLRAAPSLTSQRGFSHRRVQQ